jgi:hypothetical protein
MSVESVLSPVFVEVALIFVLMFKMGRARLGAIGAGEARIEDIALGQQNWPERALKAANAFNNQFQLPLLFIVLVGFALATRKADLLFVVMSWVFVLLRLAHAVVHVGRNDVKLRFWLYLLGALDLMAMWALFAVRILAGL